MRRSFGYVVLFASLGIVMGACVRSGDPAPAPAPAGSGAAQGRTGAPHREVSARGLPLGDLWIWAAGPAAAPQDTGSPILQLEVEIADTPEASARGLMGVDHLSDRQGMVFLWADPSSVPFWMKDTLIPLDIAFWDRNGRIFDIQQMQPCTVPEGQLPETVCPLHRPSAPYVGALEVNTGLLERSGVHAGTTVRLQRR